MGITATRAIHNRVLIDWHNLARCVLVVKLVAVALIFASPFWLEALVFTTPNYTSSLIGITLLAITSTVAILHFTQTDSYLRSLLMTGLLAHMAAASLFLWVVEAFYGGAADAFHYWTLGLRLADQFQISGWSVFKPPYWNTNLIINICGVVAVLFGDALPTLFIAFAFVPIGAGYLYYRTFTLAFPNGDRWLFGVLAVLWPSLIFWSSVIGKDALIQIFIALVCFGFAKFTLNHSIRGALVLAVGLVGVVMIRAHVAAILAIAMTLPYFVNRPRAGGTRKSLKIVLVPVLLGVTYFLVIQARTFLYSNTSGGSENQSVFQEADLVARNSQYGGSASIKGTTFTVRLAQSPFLMFRPFPWEIFGVAHNGLAFASAVESLGLIVIYVGRRREIWLTLRHWRDPYVGFLLIYVIIFSIIFGATISNSGLVVRERIMMMPPVFMLLCAMPKLQTRGSSKSLKEGRSHDPINRRVTVEPHSNRGLNFRR